LILRSIDAGAAALVEARIAGAVELDAGALIDSARSAYSAIVERLRTLEAPHPVRFWNFIPGIQAPLGPGMSRYMVFNAGRFAALRGGWVAAGADDALLPTATGVGHHQGDLLVCCLALGSPGKPVENPRQVPAYRYSARYGPLPPCFARAMEVVLPSGGPGRGDGPSLLIGGTAS